MSIGFRKFTLHSAIAILGIFALCSCETTSGYKSEANPNLSNKDYETFAILPVLPGPDDAGEDVADAIRLGPAIEEAIASMMEVKGYKRTNEKEADLQIKVIAAFSQKIEVSKWTTIDPIQPSYSQHGWIVDYPRRDIEIDNYEEGSVAVELFDSDTQEVVWVGWKEVRKPTKPKMDRVIDFFQSIMVNFPDA